MDMLPKTSLVITLPALALATVLAVGSCQRQNEPPVTPRGADAEAGVPDGAAGLTPVADAGGGAPMEDAGVTARVKTALLADEEIKSLGIHVETHDAAVTLAGTVDRDAQVTRAITIARGVAGVQQVVNRLSVKGEDKAERSNQG